MNQHQCGSKNSVLVNNPTDSEPERMKLAWLYIIDKQIIYRKGYFSAIKSLVVATITTQRMSLYIHIIIKYSSSYVTMVERIIF